MSKYSKNFVLCGDADYHCLLCEESFQILEQVERHARWEQHRKLVKNQVPLPKMRKDSIYKIRNWYYCEICNCIEQSLEAINNHVREDDHEIHKTNPLSIKGQIPTVKRDKGFVVVSKTTLSELEWNGIFKNHCIFCNTKVVDNDMHKAMCSHIINVIQAKVVKVDEDNYYRMTNTEKYFCFKCKKIYPVASLSEHWSGQEHNSHGNLEPSASKEKRKKYFSLDKKKNIATCLECQKVLTLCFLTLHDHKLSHTKDLEKAEGTQETDEELEEVFKFFTCQDHGKRRAELKEFGKDNFIKLNEGGSKGYCSLCHTYISAYLGNFIDHVKGARHSAFLELKGLKKTFKKADKPKLKTKPFLQYFKSIIHIKKSSVVLLNSEICIQVLSLMLIAPIYHRDKLICYTCDKEYENNVTEHFNAQHKNQFLQTDVVTSLKDEVVREINPGLFHCGFCNMIYPGYNLLEKHLKTWKHMQSKMQSEELLEEAITKSINMRNDSYADFLNSINVLD